MSEETGSPDANDDVPPHRYDAARAGEIEVKWQARWLREGTYRTPNPSGLIAEDPASVVDRPKLFIDPRDNLYLIHGMKPNSAAFNANLFSPGDLVIAAARADADWEDWKIVHVEKGPFLREMLGDPFRWRKEGVLSVMVQEFPKEVHQSTRLRLLDFAVRGE